MLQVCHTPLSINGIMNVEEFHPNFERLGLFPVLTVGGKVLSLGFPLAIFGLLLLSFPYKGKTLPNGYLKHETAGQKALGSVRFDRPNRGRCRRLGRT